MVEDINWQASSMSREELLNKDFIAKDYLNEIKAADIIFLPHINKREKLYVSYPEITVEFLDYLSENMESNVEVAVSDSDFKLLELHSADFIPPIMWITENVILPFLIPCIISWMDKRGSKEIELEIYKETSEGVKKISYKGDKEGLKEIAKLEREL